MRRWLLRIALALAALGVALVAADLALGLSGADWRMVEQALYYNHADASVYRVSHDPALHYEMRPGATSETADSYQVSVDAWGARGREHPWEKPAGTTRILYFGASTVFGANVRDEQTLPARLEAHLEETTGGPFEVWNLGHSAYVQSQMAHLARTRMVEVPDVDLVIVTITNAALRAFLDPKVAGEVDYAAVFEADPSHWLETFPDAPGGRTDLHGWALRHVHAYRYWQASRTARAPRKPDSAPARALCRSELLSMEAKAAVLGIPVVYANHPVNHGPPEPEARGLVLELADPTKGPEWSEIHPPPATLDAWAKKLAGMLIEEGLAPR